MAIRGFLPHWSIAILFAAFWVSSNESMAAFASRFDDRTRAQISDILFGSNEPQFTKLFFGAACSPHAGQSGSRRTLNRRKSSSSAS